MKKLFCVLSFSVLLFSCKEESKVEKAEQEITAQPDPKLKVERFDKAFFETPPSRLADVKAEYPEFFPVGTPDSIWINKMKHPLWRELYNEVEKKFGDFSQQEKDITALFKHVAYYFPQTKTPTVVTLINEMDYNNKVLYSHDVVLISLELYLGKDHKFYKDEFPEYIRRNFEARQMTSDIAEAFAVSKVPPPTDATLLSQMVYAGKKLYLKDLLVPDVKDEDKIGYTPKEIAFCKDNEGYMWSFFIENKMLFSTDSKLASRFITPAPFSKFYLEIDNETPGRIGTWIGWQIVRAYMENNKVSVEQLLKTDASEIFNKAHYKPKQNE